MAKKHTIKRNKKQILVLLLMQKQRDMRCLYIVIVVIFACKGIVFAQGKTPNLSKKGLKNVSQKEKNRSLSDMIGAKLLVKEDTEDVASNETFEYRRINQVKVQNSQKKKELKESVSNGTLVIKKAKARIALAKDLLEANKRANKISEEDYIARKTKIELVAQKAKELEYRISKCK